MNYNNTTLNNGQEIVNSFAHHFKSSFAEQVAPEINSSVLYNHLGSYQITDALVYEQCKKLKSRFTAGTDSLLNSLLKMRRRYLSHH